MTHFRNPQTLVGEFGDEFNFNCAISVLSFPRPVIYGTILGIIQLIVIITFENSKLKYYAGHGLL